MMRRATAKYAAIAAAAIAALASQAAPPRPAGSPIVGESIYATDAFPGFDGLDDIPKPEKKTKSWFLSVSRDTPAEQLAWSRAEEDAGNLRAARRGYDALVREWPASPEAPQAQSGDAQKNKEPSARERLGEYFNI